MIRKGEIVVAIDPELRDMYCCEVMANGEENTERLLCKVLYMIAYPIQHDAQNSSIPQEHAPLPANAVCRLQITRRASREDGYYHDYEASFDQCLHEYESRRRYIFDSQINTRAACRHVPQPDPKEFEILTRHAQRQFNVQRKLKE